MKIIECLKNEKIHNQLLLSLPVKNMTNFWFKIKKNLYQTVYLIEITKNSKKTNKFTCDSNNSPK